MPAPCECASTYYSLVEALDRLVENAGDLSADFAIENLRIARDLLPSVQDACGVDLGTIRNTLIGPESVAAGLAGVVLQARKIVGRMEPSLAQQALAEGGPIIAPESLRGFPLTEDLRMAGQRTRDRAREALRTAERSIDSCTTDVCTCAKSFLNYRTVTEGLRRAVEKADPEDITALSSAVRPALEAVATKCNVPQPPADQLRQIEEDLASLRSVLRTGVILTPEQKAKLLLESQPRTEREKEAEQALIQVVEEIALETPDERATRLAGVAGLRALAAKLQETGQLPKFEGFANCGCGATYAQEAPPPGFEEIMRKVGIAVMAEGERSVLDVHSDPEFLEATARIGFSIDKLASLTVDEYRAINEARAKRLVTPDQIRDFSIADLKQFAMDHPRAPPASEEEIRRRFREGLERRGLRIVHEPGEILRRPGVRRLPAGGRELVPAIVRGPPVMRIVRIREPREEPCQEEAGKLKAAEEDLVKVRTSQGFPDSVLELLACEFAARREGTSEETACGSQRDRVTEILRRTEALESQRIQRETELVKCLGPTLAKRRGFPKPLLDFVPPQAIRQYEGSRDSLLEALTDTQVYLETAIITCEQQERLPTALGVVGLL
mgnify:CR=1 FL=1